MTKEIFEKQVLMEVEKLAGDGVTIIRSDVLKVNGEKKEGICFQKDKTEISPVFYWDDLFKNNAGKLDAGVVAEQLYSMYQDLEKDAYCPDMNAFMDWDVAKTNIRIRVINYEKNLELLQQLPHRKYLDLAVVAYIRFVADGTIGTALVKSELMNFWKITEEELMGQAYKNMVSVPFSICRLDDYILELARMEMDSEWVGSIIEPLEKDRDRRPEMYIIRYEEPQFGAAAILNQEVLESLGQDLGQDCWILPCSVHEMIAVPFDGSDGFQLKEMVRKINRTEVLPDEVLSDSVYRYRYSERRLEIV